MKNENQTVAVVEKATVIRPLASLISSVKWSGDRCTELPADMDGANVIALAVGLDAEGSQQKSRGAFALAVAESDMNADKSKVFRADLLKYIVTDAKERAVANALRVEYKSDAAKVKALDAARHQGEEEAKTRYRNLTQAIRGAAYMLANPKSIGEGVSVFTVVQALGPLNTPEHPAHKAVKLALKAPSVSQSAIKQIISNSKPDDKKPVDTRSEGQKATDHLTALQSSTVFAVKSAIDKVTALHELKQSQESIISITVPMGENKPAKSFQALVSDLARLVGLDCTPMKPATPVAIPVKK